MARIYLFCLLLFQTYGCIGAQKILCIEHNLTDKKLHLKCTVEHLIYNVVIKYPSSIFGYAYCVAPTSLTKDTGGTCFCKCSVAPNCKCNLTQNLDTKATTLVIEGSGLNKMNGTFLCQHGTYSKSIVINKESRINNKCSHRCFDKKVDEHINVWMIIALVSISIGCILSIMLCWCHRTKGGKRRLNRRKRKNDVESQNLIGRCTSLPGDMTRIGNSSGVKAKLTYCDTCSTSFVCEICLNCKKRFCDSCCVHHTRIFSDHCVCHVTHIAQCQSKINCHCNKNQADRVCIQCCKPFCISCGTCMDHDENAMRKINAGTLDSIRQKNETINEHLEKKYDESIFVRKNQDDKFPVRICGIGFVENGTLTVVDSNNHLMMVFHPKNKSNVLREKLLNEPRAMTSMNGNKIAITFPFQNKIQVYAIISNENKNSMEVKQGKTICLSDIGLKGLKPFSIAFDNDFFAVEVGEGEDGTIAIIDNKRNSVRHKIKPRAFFTGHTIRLALDMTGEGQIFVSAMGIKMVSCIDFNEEEKCSISIPSPRSIVMIPNKYSDRKSIILSSRRCNALYRINHQTYEDEILRGGGGVNSPRYIAYHEKGNRLCVQVVKNSEEDELAIFELKISEHPQSINVVQ